MGSVRDPAALAKSNVCMYTLLKYTGSVLSFCLRPDRAFFIAVIESMLVVSAKATHRCRRRVLRMTNATYVPGMAAHPCTKGSFSHSPVAFDPRSVARQNNTGSYGSVDHSHESGLANARQRTDDGSIPSFSQYCIVPSIVMSLGLESSGILVSAKNPKRLVQNQRLALELLPDLAQLLLFRLVSFAGCGRLSLGVVEVRVDGLSAQPPEAEAVRPKSSPSPSS